MRGQIRKSYHTWFKSETIDEPQGMLNQLLVWLEKNPHVHVKSIALHWSEEDTLDVYYERSDEVSEVLVADWCQDSSKGTA